MSKSLRMLSSTALGRKLERTARFVMQIGLPFSSTNDKKKSSNTKLYGLRQDPERTVRFAMQNGLSLSSTNDKKSQNTKLYGPRQDLERTARFVMHVGLP